MSLNKHRRRRLKEIAIKQNRLQIGQRITESRLTSDGREITYSGLIISLDPFQVIPWVFRPAVDEPVPGYPDWWRISAHYADLRESLPSQTGKMIRRAQVGAQD